MSVTQDLGKVSVIPKGAWSSSNTYERNDIVTNGGGAYISKQDVPSGILISNTTYWLQITEKGEKGDEISAISCEKTGTSGAVDTYTLTVTLTSGDAETFTFEVTNGSVTSVNGRTGAVTGLAEDDGYYEDMSVGSADQLISTVYVEDEVPYNFRTSGGTADIGDREFDEIHGGTIAWNQVADIGDDGSGLTFTVDANGVVSINGTAAGAKILIKQNQYYSGHRYMFLLETLANPNEITFTVGASLGSPWLSDAGTVGTHYLWLANSYNTSISLYDCANKVFDGVKLRIQIFDITQMFGSTIAEYLYTLGITNGLAWFRNLFPKPYYAYNAGTLLSVTGLSKHKMVAFNAWDEEWESGYINPTTGLPEVNSSKIRMKNYMPVLPNTTYYKKSPAAFWNVYFDANKNYIGYNDATPNTTFTTPANAYFIRSGFETAYGTTYHNDICINLSWDGERDGEYEEYKAYEYALDSSLTLRGIPKLDANNKLYYDGDVYESDGTVTRRYAAVDMGTLSWSYQSDNTRFSTTITGIKRSATSTSVPNIISSRYAATNYAATTGSVPPNMTVAVHNNYDNVYVVDTAYTDKNAFTSAVSGVYLVYELATPTTESADSFTYAQTVDDFGTEEYVIAEQSGVAMPVGHFTRYTNNLRAKLEMAPESPSGAGDYIVRQTDGENTYVPLVIPTELPTNPSEDGTYVLKATVSSGVTTLSWESAT